MNEPLRGARRRGLLPLAGLAALLTACAGTPVPVAVPAATVVNHTGKPLQDLRYQSCNSAADQWAPLPASALKPGATTKFTLPADCVNFDAYYADGRLAGSQRSIRRDFPFQWVLR